MEEIFVTRSFMPPFEEYTEEIRDIWQTHWLTNMGSKHQKLEKELQEYLGVRHVSLMVNGHMALEMTLQAMNLSGEVITTPFTFASTTHAIVRNGLTPVFCDIREDDYTIDADKIEGLVTDRTAAIVPVHVYGNICQVEKIQHIAQKHGLKVIYDAAHAFGERYKGKGAASFGDASILSFHATKVFNTIEGGAVCFADDDMVRTLYNLKNFGIQSEECVESVGANAKMNEFQAAMGLCNLRHVKKAIEERKRAAETYQKLLAGIPGIRCWQKQKDVEANYAYFPIRVEKETYGESRDELYARLGRDGIHARKYFYPLTSSFACYQGRAEETPIAEKISHEILCLPMYAELEEETVERICNRVRRK